MDKIFADIVPHHGHERRVKRRTTLTPSVSPRSRQPSTPIISGFEAADIPLPATPPEMQEIPPVDAQAENQQADIMNIDPNLQNLFRRPPATPLSSSSTAGAGRRTREVVNILTETINRLIRAAEED